MLSAQKFYQILLEKIQIRLVVLFLSTIAWAFHVLAFAVPFYIRTGYDYEEKAS